MNWKSLTPLLLIVFVDILGMMMIIPLLPFFAIKLGASVFETGIITASYAAMQIIFSPVLGRLSDRFGRKTLLLLSQFFLASGFFFLASAQTVGFVFFARILSGIGAGNLSLVQAMISDSTADENRTKAFGLFGAVFGLALTIGPAISGALAKINWSVPIYSSFALSCVSILLTTLLLPKGLPSKGKGPALGSVIKKFIIQPRPRQCFLQFIFFFCSFAFLISGLGLIMEMRFTNSHGEKYGPSEIGYLFGALGVIGIVIQGFMLPKLEKRFGDKNLSSTGFILTLLGYVGVGLSQNVFLFFVACGVFGIGNSLIRPTVTSRLTKSLHKSEEGLALGFSNSLQSLAQVLCPPLGAYFIQQQWVPQLGLLMAGLSLLGYFAGVKQYDSVA
ncbi:MFS transporter [Bdellovibrio sp. HCB-162]|uniref:MFS transporter n=1 Tax=Bdellovibrio sp. HCB-162 TaxID=3394234 RepID=UPI0039BC440B